MMFVVYQCDICGCNEILYSSLDFLARRGNNAYLQTSENDIFKCLVPARRSVMIYYRRYSRPRICSTMTEIGVSGSSPDIMPCT